MTKKRTKNKNQTKKMRIKQLSINYKNRYL